MSLSCCRTQNFLCNAPLPCPEPRRKGSHKYLQRGNQQRSPFFPPLPFSSELWTCLKVQVMSPFWMALVLWDKFKGIQSRPVKLQGKCFLLSRQKSLKSEGFIEIQRWEPRRKLKIIPWLVGRYGFFSPLQANQIHTAVPLEQLDTPRRSLRDAKKMSPGEKVNVLTSYALIGFLTSEAFAHRFYSDKSASVWTICLNVFSPPWAEAAGKTWSRTDETALTNHSRGVCGTGSERCLNYIKVLITQRMK